MLLGTAEMAHCLHKTQVPALLNEGPSSVVDLQQDRAFCGSRSVIILSGGEGAATFLVRSIFKKINGGTGTLRHSMIQLFVHP